MGVTARNQAFLENFGESLYDIMGFPETVPLFSTCTVCFLQKCLLSNEFSYCRSVVPAVRPSFIILLDVYFTHQWCTYPPRLHNLKSKPSLIQFKKHVHQSQTFQSSNFSNSFHLPSTQTRLHPIQTVAMNFLHHQRMEFLILVIFLVSISHFTVNATVIDPHPPSGTGQTSRTAMSETLHQSCPGSAPYFCTFCSNITTGCTATCSKTHVCLNMDPKNFCFCQIDGAIVVDRAGVAHDQEAVVGHFESDSEMRKYLSGHLFRALSLT